MMDIGNRIAPLSTPQVDLMARLARVFYAEVPEDFQTYCTFTARIVHGVLTRAGIPAQLLPCQVWCATPQGNFVVGFIGHRPQALKWDGHVVCSAGDRFIDASLKHFTREFSVAVPPVIMGRRFLSPTHVISRYDLDPSRTLWWHDPPAGAEPIPTSTEPPDMIERYAKLLFERVSNLPVTTP